MYINTPVYVGKILQLVVHPYSVCSLLRAIIQNTYTIHTAYTCILQEHENKIFVRALKKRMSFYDEHF